MLVPDGWCFGWCWWHFYVWYSLFFVGLLTELAYVSLSLSFLCVLFSSHCCLFWFLFGNLCIFTGFSFLLRFSFSLLGLWIFLLFSLWCASCFTLLSRVYGLFEGVLNPFLPSTHLCSLPASSHSLLLSFLFTMNVVCPFSWIKQRRRKAQDFTCIVDLVLWSWISLILCSPFTSILYVLLILRMYYDLEYQWFCVLYLPQFRGFLLPSCRSSFWMNRRVMKSTRLRIKFFVDLEDSPPPPPVNQLLT